MCCCPICKEPSRYCFTLFITNKENFRCKLIITDISRCLDPHNSAPASTITLICPEKATETITIRKPVHVLRLPTACSATSPNFYLPPRYQTSNLDVNVSLNMVNLHMINVSTLDFCIWQHLRDNRSETQLQHLPTIPLILVHKIYQHLINGTQHIMPFDTTDESTEDTDLIWTLFFTYRNVHYSYWIAYTSRIGIILLLLLLVLTCQISTNLYNQVTCNIQLWMMM